MWDDGLYMINSEIAFIGLAPWLRVGGARCETRLTRGSMGGEVGIEVQVASPAERYFASVGLTIGSDPGGEPGKDGVRG